MSGRRLASCLLFEPNYSSLLARSGRSEVMVYTKPSAGQAKGSEGSEVGHQGTAVMQNTTH